MPATPTAWWNFETLTVTGFESDLDIGGAIPILATGASLATPCPSVSGKVGIGRLMANFNRYNSLSTAKETSFARSSGVPLSFSFWWRPLVQLSTSGDSMLSAFFLGFTSGGSIGVLLCELYVYSGSSGGLYDFKIKSAPANETTFTNVPMTFRDWNLITVTSDGSTLVTVYVNGVSIGTLAMTGPFAACTSGQFLIAKDSSVNGTQCGLVDMAGVWLTDELSAGDVEEIYGGWTP